MSILDSLKRKKKTEKPAEKKPVADDVAKKEKKQKQEKPETEMVTETVMTPEGKLVEVQKKQTKKETKKKAATPKKEDTGTAYRVLIHPLITEKGSLLGTQNQYLFAVAPGTNKIEIRKAIHAVYGIMPTKVRVMNMSGKYVRYGRSEGTTKHWKKAIITLPEGKKIDIQEGL